MNAPLMPLLAAALALAPTFARAQQTPPASPPANAPAPAKAEPTDLELVKAVLGDAIQVRYAMGFGQAASSYIADGRKQLEKKEFKAARKSFTYALRLLRVIDGCELGGYGDHIPSDETLKRCQLPSVKDKATLKEKREIWFDYGNQNPGGSTVADITVAESGIKAADEAIAKELEKKVKGTFK